MTPADLEPPVLPLVKSYAGTVNEALNSTASAGLIRRGENDGGGGQAHRHPGAAALGAVDEQLAAMGLDDARRDRQAEAGALILLLIGIARNLAEAGEGDGNLVRGLVGDGQLLGRGIGKALIAHLDRGGAILDYGRDTGFRLCARYRSLGRNDGTGIICDHCRSLGRSDMIGIDTRCVVIDGDQIDRRLAVARCAILRGLETGSTLKSIVSVLVLVAFSIGLMLSIENVFNAGKQFLTGHPIEAFKTLLKAPFQFIGDSFSGAGQALRGGIGLVGSAITIGGIVAAPFTGGLSLLPALLSHSITGYGG